MNKCFVIGILVCASIVNTAFAGPEYSYQRKVQPPLNNALRDNTIMVPAGTTIRTIVTSPLSSKYTLPGQTVTTALCEDFYYNSKLIAPAGSIFSGIITESSKAKSESVNGILNIRFNNITTPYGTQIPINGAIFTGESSGALVCETNLDIKSKMEKRKDIEMPLNTFIDLVLIQPVTVSSALYYYEN